MELTSFGDTILKNNFVEFLIHEVGGCCAFLDRILLILPTKTINLLWDDRVGES